MSAATDMRNACRSGRGDGGSPEAGESFRCCGALLRTAHGVSMDKPILDSWVAGNGRVYLREGGAVRLYHLPARLRLPSASKDGREFHAKTYNSFLGAFMTF